MKADEVMDRKTFLKEGPRALLRAFLQGARREDRPAARGSPVRLRPPGAAEEGAFLARCCGVGACAAACPADAIRLLPRREDAGRLAPVIVPREAPCVVCEELACMRACPSGALSAVPREEIRIGLARIDPEVCLAWTGVDPGCGYCADRCPLGPKAIALEGGGGRRKPVVKEGCVGCGVCEFYCPARPAAIRVIGVEPCRTSSLSKGEE